MTWQEIREIVKTADAVMDDICKGILEGSSKKGPTEEEYYKEVLKRYEEK